MDFTQALKSDYDTRVAPRVLARNAARDVVGSIRTQIEREEEALQASQTELNNLDAGIPAALVEGPEAYAKVEAALEAARSKEQQSAKRLEHLRRLLPERLEAFYEASRRLEEQRVLLARENLAVVQTEIDRHAQAILDLYDSWIVSHFKLAAESGDGFLPALDSRPEIKNDRIGKVFLGLIKELPQSEYAERARQQTEKEKK